MTEKEIKLYIESGMNEWNRKHPHLAILPSARDSIEWLALKRSRVMYGHVIMLDGKGEDFTTNSGYGSMYDWINEFIHKG